MKRSLILFASIVIISIFATNVDAVEKENDLKTRLLDDHDEENEEKERLAYVPNIDAVEEEDEETRKMVPDDTDALGEQNDDEKKLEDANIDAVREENAEEKPLIDLHTDHVNEEDNDEQTSVDVSPEINVSDPEDQEDECGDHDPVVERVDDITKSQRDERSYRGLRLCNDLHVLLISDPETDRAAASLALVVGMMHDPDDFPELSHLLERMLFRGSKKYKAENYFAKYVEDRAGMWNGGTAEGWQEFHWNISDRHLAEILDMYVSDKWAQFFVKPRLDPKVMMREIKIVDSRNVGSLEDDYTRIDLLKKLLSKPGHPYGRFVTGTLEDLHRNLTKKGINIRDRLLDFHSEWYSSNIMYLALLGKENLDEMEKIVVPLFKNIRNKKKPKLQYDEQPWGPEQLMKKVYYVPVSDLRLMIVQFPLPWVEDNYKAGPLSYMDALIGHEGPGSLFTELQERDWAESLFAGYENIPGFSFYYVYIMLTEDGLDYVDEIIKLLFQYIHLLKREGAKEWLFNEIKTVSQMNFDFKDKEEPVDYVQTLSSSLIDYRFEDVLSFHIPTQWNKGLIDACTEYLKPDNMNVLLVSQSYEAIADQTIEWYGAQYGIENISEDLIEELWKITEPFDKFYLPPLNEFIAEKFDLYPLDENWQSTIPRILHESSISQFWYKQDTEFRLPRLFVKFNIFSPVTCVNGKNEKLTELFVDLFKDKFSTEYGYAASQANYEWSVTTIICGLQITVSGFTEKLSSLLEKLLTKIINFEWKENKFEIAKESLVRRLVDFRTYQPHEMANSYISYLLHSYNTNQHPAYEAPTVANSLQVDDMKRLTDQLFSRVFLQGLIYGNADDELAQNLVNIIEGSFSKSSVVLSQEIVFPRVLWMDDKSNFRYEAVHTYSKDSCYYGHFQLDFDYPIVNVVLTDLFVKFVHEKCIQKLLVEEVLGYSVDCGLTTHHSVLSFTVVVQSEKHPGYLKSRVEAFLHYIHKILIEMEKEEFEQNKIAVKDLYTKKTENQVQRFYSYWSEITNRRFHFTGRGRAKIDTLHSLQQEDLLNFFEEHILESGSKRKRLDIHVISEVTNPVLEDGLLVDSTEMDDAVLFRSGFGTFPHMFPQMQVAGPGFSVPLQA